MQSGCLAVLGIPVCRAGLLQRPRWKEGSAEAWVRDIQADRERQQEIGMSACVRALRA